MSRIHCVPPFARKRAAKSALAAMVVALLPAGAAAEAARVTFAHGAVAAIAADGTRRAVGRNSDIDAGDTISTGRGRAQLRFTDGSFVSLKPNTEFRVDEYAYKGREDTQQRGFFSLLRGGLRTITGFIGRTRKAAYRMRTSVATIGIRGTEYSLSFDGERLQWAVADDGVSAISIVLDSGLEQIIGAGGFGSATREQFEQLVRALQQLADDGQLQSLDRDAILALFAAGDLIDANRFAAQLAALVVEAQAPPQAPPPDCASAVPACAIVTAFGAFNVDDGTSPVANTIVDGGEGITAVFDSVTGGLLSHTAVRSGNPVADGQLGSAQVVVDGSANFSVDTANPDARANATWGRWIAPTGADGQSIGTSGSLHPLKFTNGNQDTFAYVVSIPPLETFNQGSAVYDLTGFTPPAVFTPGDPGAGAAALGAPGTVTGSLTANFGTAQVGVSMNVPFANGSYNLSGSGLNMFAGPGFTGQGQPFFAGGGNVSVSSGGGITCVEGCNGDVAGNLFGPAADGAALGYVVRDFELSSDVTGAAVFKQQSCDNCAVVAPPSESISLTAN